MTPRMGDQTIIRHLPSHENKIIRRNSWDFNARFKSSNIQVRMTIPRPAAHEQNDSINRSAFDCTGYATFKGPSSSKSITFPSCLLVVSKESVLTCLIYSCSSILTAALFRLTANTSSCNWFHNIIHQALCVCIQFKLELMLHNFARILTWRT
jgi:hypothetical protein